MVIPWMSGLNSPELEFSAAYSKKFPTAPLATYTPPRTVSCPPDGMSRVLFSSTLAAFQMKEFGAREE